MRKLAVSISIVMIFLATLPTQADPGDFLEIYPVQLRVHGLTEPFTVEEGQPVLMYCDWSIGLADGHSYWHAGGKAQLFSVRILVDGIAVGSFEGGLGPRTQIGINPEDGHRHVIVGPKTSGPAAWVANGPGEHKAVCVVNEPKTVSDRWPQNNTTSPVTIRVTSKNAPVKGSLKKPPMPPAEQIPTAQPITQTSTSPSGVRRSATTLRPAEPASPPPQQQPTAPTDPKAGLPVAAATVLVVEAETMISTAAVSGGQMVRQEMVNFGTDWGGDAQLFWRPPAPSGDNAQLTVAFELPSAGTYALALYYTVAPDFGQFTVYVDGRESNRLDGYGQGVSLSRSVLGRYPLAAGRHELSFHVTGKSQRSIDYIVGLDRLQLTLVSSAQ